MRAICSNCKWITDIALFKRNWERFAHCHFFVISEVSDALLISATRAIFSRLLCLQSDKSESLRSLMTKERPGANPSWAKSERTNSQPCKNVTIKKKLRYLSTPPFLPVDILLLLFFLFTHTSFITFIFIILVHEITVLSLVRLNHIVITVLLKQDIYSI